MSAYKPRPERVLVVTTDGKNIYHHVTIVKAADGSYYSLGEDESRREDHISYHGTGQVNFHFGGILADSKQFPPPSQMDRIFGFPSKIAHEHLTANARPLEDIKKFKPTSVVYVDLKKAKGRTINIHAFLFDPGVFDFFKIPFLFDNEVIQMHFVTANTPWVGILVIKSPEGVTGMGGPFIHSRAGRSAYEEIDKMFFDKFFKERRN